jgi:hypothetical protein
MLSIHDLRWPIGLALFSSVAVAQAQSCALPIPFKYEFQSRATATLSAPIATDPCAFAVSVDGGAGPTAAAFLHYRRATPLTSVRYGFRIYTTALSGFAGGHSFQVFSASSPVVTGTPSAMSSLLTLSVRGSGADPELIFRAANGGGLPANAVQSLPLGGHTVRVEIGVGAGTSGAVRYWIDHAYSDTPDGVIDNGGAGLDNGAWLGVVGAEIGVSSASNQFRSGNAGNVIVFDQIESSDDVLFYDDFTSGAQ